ncbi:hypothetical protein ACTXT7_004569, partial [Hymenolepis weldensis]
MSLRNSYYNELFNGKPPERDSGYGVSRDISFADLPRSSSSNSLIFSMSPPNDTIPLVREDFPDESIINHAEAMQYTTVMPVTYVKGFKHGGIEICVPGLVHSVFKPPRGMKVEFRLPQEGDTEEINKDLFIKAGWQQIDYYKDRIERIRRKEPVPSSSVSSAHDWREDQHSLNGNRLYSNYFNGLDSNQSNNADTESCAESNSNLFGLFDGNLTNRNWRRR